MKHFSIAGYYNIAIFIKVTLGFYLPGLAPVNYCIKKQGVSTECKVTFDFWSTFDLFNNVFFQNDVAVFVNRLNSEEAIIPYEYHQ